MDNKTLYETILNYTKEKTRKTSELQQTNDHFHRCIEETKRKDDQLQSLQQTLDEAIRESEEGSELLTNGAVQISNATRRIQQLDEEIEKTRTTLKERNGMIMEEMERLKEMQEDVEGKIEMEDQLHCNERVALNERLRMYKRKRDVYSSIIHHYQVSLPIITNYISILLID